MKVGLVTLLFLITIAVMMKVTGISSMGPLGMFVGAFGLIVVVGFATAVLMGKRNGN